MLGTEGIKALKRRLIWHIGETFGKDGVLWSQWNRTGLVCDDMGAEIEFFPTVIGDCNKGFLVNVKAKGIFWHDGDNEIGHFRLSWIYAGTSTF